MTSPPLGMLRTQTIVVFKKLLHC